MMEKLALITLILVYFTTVVTNMNNAASIAGINKTYQDLQSFCKGKNRDFCSKEYIKVSMEFLQNQLDQIKRNMEREQQEAKKQRIHEKKPFKRGKNAFAA